MKKKYLLPIVLAFVVSAGVMGCNNKKNTGVDIQESVSVESGDMESRENETESGGEKETEGDPDHEDRPEDQVKEQRDSEFITCPKMGSEDFPQIDGSTATLPLSQAIYRLATGATQEEAVRAIRHDKTTQAYLNLIGDWGPDLVIAYEPGDTVKERLEEEGSNLIIKPVGRDALVFMANAGNPVESLTGKQVVDIYTGGITNWNQVGGNNKEICAFQRQKASGSQNLMEKLVMKGTSMANAPLDYVISDMGELIEKVSSYDNTGEALGYSVYFYAKNMYQKPELKFMAIDGVIPSSDTIREGTYPYVSDFYAAVREDEPKDSNAYRLFEWLTSDDGQALINELGYVGIRDERKQLPEGFDEEEEVFTGTISLENGEYILADGEWLYGEQGIGVFDGAMRLVKFIEHLDSQEIDPFMIWTDGSFLPVQDTRTGKYGIYSISEQRWVYEPVYDNVFETKDGFGLEEESWDGSVGYGKWRYSYDYVDREGKILKKGVESEERIWGESDEYYTAEEFLEKNPEIGKEFEVTSDDIFIFSTEFQENIAVIEKGSESYFYDMRGRCLFKFDKNQLSGGKDQMIYPILVDKHVTYLVDYGSEYQSDVNYYIYRDGVLVKTLKIDGNSEYSPTIENGFYIRQTGNYLYVYNYEDELCGKFLAGYYRND